MTGGRATCAIRVHSCRSWPEGVPPRGQKASCALRNTKKFDSAVSPEVRVSEVNPPSGTTEPAGGPPARGRGWSEVQFSAVSACCVFFTR